MDKKLSRIQYISNGLTIEEQEQNIRIALDAGIKWVQLRWKNSGSELELFQLAENCKKLCQSYQATFIVNDHVELAIQLDADGLHLGLSDESVENARLLLGGDKIIGGTANTYTDVLQRCVEKCDYIGLGPFRFTETKQKLSPILGVSGYQEIMDKLKRDQVQAVPIFAIGGLQENDIAVLHNIGIQGVAVSGLIQKDPSVVLRINQFYEKEYVEDCR